MTKIIDIKNQEKPISIEIVVNYDGGAKHGKGCNYFSNLQELKNWCDRHQELAEKLGYKKQKK